MIASRFFVEFIMFSFCGWVYESTYCTIQNGHWRNRGFLFGPICPIYGFGAMLVRLIATYSSFAPGSGKNIPLWQLFLMFMIGSAVLEYITSWGMEKLFHARWWDYSSMPLNINGRICLPASLLFGAAGTVGWVYIIPILPKVHIVSNSLMLEILSLVLMGVLGGDLVISVDSTMNLIKKLEMREATFNEAAEKGVLKIRSIPLRVKEARQTARTKVQDMTHSIKPKMVHIIENPSEQLKEFKLKLSGREWHMLEHIQSYHQINGEAGTKHTHHEDQ